MRYYRAATIMSIGAIILLLFSCTSPHMSSGKIALNAGNYEEAVRQFTLAIGQEPENAEAYYCRGIAFGRSKKWIEYATDTEKAFAIDSKFKDKATRDCDTDNHSLYFFYAAKETFFSEKDFELTIKRTDESLLFNKRNVYSLNLKALSLAELKRDEEAERTFRKSIEVNPNFIDSYIYVAGFYKRKFEYGKEEEVLRQAIKIVDNPEWFGTVHEDSLKVKKADAANVYHALGTNLFNQQKYEEAEEQLEKAQQFDPENRDIAYNLGMVFVGQESWEKALNVFEKIITLNPEDTQAHYYLGFSYLMLKRYPDALVHFTRAIELDPEWCDTYFKRALCYRELGKTAEANSDIKKGKECEEQKNE